MALAIPPPVLPGTSVPLTQPVNAMLAGLMYADGSAVAAADVTSIGVFVFRGSPGTGQVWDDAQRQWRPTPADSELMTLKPLPATAKPGVAPSWTAMLVAVGQKDASEAPVYAVASGGAPSYFLRGLAKARRAAGGEEGLSVASASFTFVDATAKSRFSTQFDTPTTPPEAATRVRLQLKGAALQPAGYVEIRTLPAFEVEIANCDAGGNPLARIVLAANGEIHLRPAAGARVVLEGDVETNRILYAPAGGGVKRWLP
jgi:hypothetical protein